MLNNNKMPWPTYPQAQAQNTMMPMSMPSNQMVPMNVAGTQMMPNMMMQSTVPPQIPAGIPMTPNGMTFPAPVQEESYVENILRMNLGKVATLYMTYENNSEWNAKIFKGVLEAAGRDHIIISDPVTGKRYLLLTLNLDYITFDEPINYTLPFGSMPTR
ncbi:spore coat protein GerQ [Cohnella sp. WQ 127256]|uniref:spore coat protein GerQ n=1 Tax=Cohnella sp. WQ 127256 TaxID=2938790 RepID=UPI003556C7F6